MHILSAPKPSKYPSRVGPPTTLITPESSLLQKNLQKRVQKMSSIYRRNEGLYIAQFVEENGKQKYLYARKRKDVKAKLAARSGSARAVD
jgi:hypothetical protein